MSVWTERITALEKQTAMLSTPPMIARAPVYQDYVAAGDESVPHLLMALKGSPASMAIVMLLEEITGQQPVKPSDIGHVPSMIKAWDAWGKSEAARLHSEAVLRAWDESQHPRDEHGKFTDSGGDDGGAAAEPAGGGKGKHPGKGYSKAAYVDNNGVIQTTSVEDAARALHENRRVNLDQPKKISMLITKLGEISKEMIAKGEKAPTYNLCNATIHNTSLFCVENVGIPRIQMPQLDDEQTKAFRKHLKELGYEVTKESIPAAYLHATQNELNGVKVAGIAEHLKDKPDHHGKRIIVSKDNYILDGHHHYAAKIGLDAADNVLTNDTGMRVARVNIDIIRLLEEAEKFTGGRGKKGAEETTTGKSFPTTILADLVHEQMSDPRWHEWRALRTQAMKLLGK